MDGSQLAATLVGLNGLTIKRNGWLYVYLSNESNYTLFPYISKKRVSTKYQFRDPGKLYFVSFAVVYWIDLFIRNEYKDFLLDSWRYCQANKGLRAA
jgi:hypothetical protein